jgi:hypothetical protein
MLGVPVLSNVLFARSIISGLGLGTLRSSSLCLTQTHMNTFTCVVVEQASGTIITRTHAHVFLSSVCCVTVWSKVSIVTEFRV